MKTTPILIIVLLILGINKQCYSQDDEVKAYNNYTFYYLDNSEGYQADPMHNELVEELKNNLNKLTNRTDNYFFLYAANGDEYKINNNLASLNSSGFIKKYVAKPSKEADYYTDKTAIRENVVEYAVRVKQNVELNFYLSSNAIKKLVKNIDDLPTPLTMISEMLIYLNSQDLKIRVNVYYNKDAATTLGEEKIKSYFIFCQQELGMTNIQTELNPL